MTDELIDFLIQVAQNPQLAIALLVEPILQTAWMPLLATGIVAGCGFVAVKRWRRRKRKQDGMELHELVMPPSEEPHTSDETDLRAAEIDEEMFCAWYKDLTSRTRLIFTENEARKLYQVKDRARKSEVMD